MSKLKHAALVLVAASLMTAQAQASEPPATQVQAQSVAAFSDAEIAAMFESSGPSKQLVALSQQEMKETEGAFMNFGTAAFGGIVGGAGFAWGVHRGIHTWNTSRFLGNVGTGALIGGTFGAAGAFASGGARFIPSLTNTGANIWRFNSAVANFGPNLAWRR